MKITCASFVADLRESLHVVEELNSSSRYVVDLLNIDNSYFYPSRHI